MSAPTRIRIVRNSSGRVLEAWCGDLDLMKVLPIIDLRWDGHSTPSGSFDSVTLELIAIVTVEERQEPK